ncbi:MAG: hypothetical protein ACT4PO_15875 [Actinomycetota bacterium]
MPPTPISHRHLSGRRFSRRDVLRLVGAAGFFAVLPDALVAPAAGSVSSGAGRWSDPDTWGGIDPGPNEVVVIKKRVVLDENARVAGVIIEPDGELVFEPDHSRTLRCAGNVTVRGRLTMRPAGPKTVHRLIFPGVHEQQFVGGGHEVLDSDVGLWVMDRGKLDVAGAAKDPWLRASGSIPAGATEIGLAGVPNGWSAGDEVAMAPTAPDDYLNFEIRTITDVAGSQVGLSSPTDHLHPAIAVGGNLLGAEVLNLTRNVRIEGTASGRAHVFLHVTRPQTLEYASIRHMGPRRSPEEKILGRYGLHFHECNQGSLGSTVEGVVIRDTGNHAFVPHQSHGITLDRCVSFATQEHAFWWDPPESKTVRNATNGSKWLSCVAADVTVDGDADSFFTLAGFSHGEGDDNVATGCVAVGVRGGVTSSGFLWPARVIADGGVWVHDDNVAHNNSKQGVFVWQNASVVHLVRRLLCYNNGSYGIDHGAYIDPFQYIDCTLIGNGLGGVLQHAGQTILVHKYEGLVVDSAGRAPYGITITKHSLGPPGRPLFLDCAIEGYTLSTVNLDERTLNPGFYDFVNVTVAGARDLEPTDFHLGTMHPESVFRVQRRDGSAYQLDGPNLTVTAISTFYP